MNASEVFDVSLSRWVPGTRFFQTDDSYFVVTADVSESRLNGKTFVVQRPTVILFTSATARPTDLTPDFTSPPGTSHEEAIQEAGFTLITP